MNRTLSPEIVARLRMLPFRVKMHLRELYIVTKYKDNCVYKTRSLGFIICDKDYLRQHGIIITSLSTEISKDLY